VAQIGEETALSLCMGKFAVVGLAKDDCGVLFAYPAIFAHGRLRLGTRVCNVVTNVVLQKL
jgi:hypothetical protein